MIDCGFGVLKKFCPIPSPFYKNNDLYFVISSFKDAFGVGVALNVDLARSLNLCTSTATAMGSGYNLTAPSFALK